jgi:hypothetical protein
MKRRHDKIDSGGDIGDYERALAFAVGDAGDDEGT